MGDYKIKRQAVIVIHGIGEQRPMETLRDFVKGVKAELEKSDASESRSTVRSKPDSIGEIYETVCLSMDSSRKRPITDFYEFYWAHNMRRNQFVHMFSWIFRLLFTWVESVPPRLRLLWWFIWILAVAFLGCSIYFSFSSDHSTIRKVIMPIIALSIFPFLVSILGAIAKTFILNYAGDAARYLTPDPANISERNNIRRQGISFLKKLHTISTSNKVDRIIIVAHSLGSVIAYDLMRLLWSEYNKVYLRQLTIDQTELHKMDKLKVQSDRKSLREFQNQQFSTWKEQRINGNPWLISDFITLGGALNAADYFIVSQEPFEVMVEQRELPVCPPIKDEKDGSMIYSPPPFEIEGQKRSIYLLNWSAMFAVTRWTNIFFRSDFVGGPMGRKFGNGILDIELPRKSFFLLPGGHTSYWNLKDKNNALPNIIKAMRLNPEA